MTTAIVSEPTQILEGEHRFLLPGVDWEGYEALLKMIGDGRTRITYDRGDVELMSPSQDHEAYAELIGRIILTVTEELRIPCCSLRSTTWRKKVVDGGLEADNCFYLASLAQVGGKKDIDLNIDPPPDLAIEIEISRSALNRLRVYAGLGVPEVWRFDGERLVVHVLQSDGAYKTVPASPSVPAVRPDEVVRWIHECADGDQIEWDRRLRAWVRDELLPRHENR